MADLGCSFFSSRSFNTNYNLPLFLPPKRYYSSALHSHNSRIKRSSHHLLLLFKPSPFAASASDIDVISTHEHSDGSFLFRFGDPSEIEKNVEMEEPETVEEEIEGDDKNGTSVVKLKEGGDEAEVIASGLTEASDRADSIVSSSNTVIAVEGESEFSEKLLEDDTELPVLTSNKEIGGISTPDLGIERAENVEDINEEYKDSSPVGASIPDESSKIENCIATVEVSSDVSLEETSNVTSTSKETEITSIPGVDEGQLTVNVEECLEQEDSPADASILDQSSEVVGNVTTVALSGKESDDTTSSDIDTDQSGKVEEGLSEDHEDSPVDATVLGKSSEVVNGTSTVALLEEDADDITSISDIKIEPTGNVEGGIIEEYEDSSVDDTSVLDNKPEVLNIISTEASSEEETADITSTSDIKIEPTGNVEESKDEEYEDSPAGTSVLDKRFEVLNIITAEASSEKETDGIAFPSDIETEPTENVEEGINEEFEDSPVDTSVLDNKSEVLNIITTEASSEEETADITSNFDNEIEPKGDVEESKDEEYEDSPVDTSVLDKKSEVLNIITTEASSEEETVDITSTYDIELEPTGTVVESKDEEYEDSPVDTSVPSKVLNVITTEALSEKETDGISFPSDIEIEPTGNVEEGINEEYEDSPGDTSVLDKSSEVLNVITTEELSEKETADITSAPNIAIEHTGNVEVEQGLDEVLEEPSSVDASRPNIMRSEVENDNTAQDFLRKETADATTLVAFKTDPVVAGLDTDSYQGSLEVADTTNAAPISEHQNEETVIRDETIGDGGESFDNNLVSPSPQLEPAMSLNEEIEEPIIQAELQTLAIEESSETDVDNIKGIEMQNVLSNDNESDMYGAEAESPTMEPAMPWSIGSEEQASGSGSEIQKETVGYASEIDTIQLMTVPPQLEADSMREEETGTETVKEPRDDDASENQTVGDDLVETSVHEVIAESTGSTITSQEMLITDFVLSSGAALLPHPSKVLTGGEDAYFIAGQTWLGLADGVSQWSLEGTIEGVYAQELIKNCEKLITECNGNSINNPVELLNLSVAQTHSPGSSTVLIAQFDGQALHVANVGDSGFIVLRHGAVYKRSSPMHHAFSLPVHIERGDDPSCVAQLYRVDLEEEDLIVLATDGLLDNLYDQEISLIAMKSLADHKSPEEIAVLLAKRAQEVGSSASGRSPFADDAQAAGFPGYSGGKLDDVAVIVSVVQRRR